MRGDDCHVEPDWWTTPRAELMSANRAVAEEVVALHKKKHPKPCPRQKAAADYLARTATPSSTS